ncbi:MAG: sulfite exporter TauE/SafE family protein [Actinobacteria bacterium]|nr:sulfite exporter TauE/SafE family protein [Actinomycetota bacterium]MCL5069839.1 sulfite exporter TauE/SafE family protein [Actinomycetota bacterium]
MLVYFFLIIVGLFAGLIGSTIGIGGGLLIVPILSLAMKIPIHAAIGTSIVAVLATSVASSRRFIKKGVTNIPLGMVLEIPTTFGAILGSLLVVYIKNNILFAIFGIFVFAAGLFTFLKNRFKKPDPILSKVINGSFNKTSDTSKTTEKANSAIFDSEYYEETLKKHIKYHVVKLPAGLGISFFAGFFSGLLGIGGGIIKVPALNVIMDVPLKAATATSSFMIGITAVVSSIIYFYNGYINPLITILIVFGVLAGSTFGSFIAGKLAARNIAFIILTVFSIIGMLMFLRAFNILNY